MAVQYKFVELSVVTDESLETTVNEWVAQGWQFDGIRFVTTEHSKRPSMAFVSFTRDAAPATVDLEPPRSPAPRRPAAPPGDPSVITAADGDDVE